MQDGTLTQLIEQIIFYSICNSFVVFGILQTIKRITEKETLNRFIGLGVTYAIGIIMGFMLWNDIPIWQKIIHGFFIGSTSVAVYKSATQSLLEIIPTLVERFFKSNKQ